MVVDAVSGIGSGDPLETDIAELDLSISGVGAAEISEKDAILLTDVDTTDGAIDIAAGGTITAKDVVAGGTNDITLETTAAGNIITGTGILTEEELVDALKKHLTQDEDKFNKYRYSLADYTAVTKLDVSTEAIHRIADICISASSVNPEAVVASVADQDLIYGLARMAEMLRDGSGWENRVFRNRQIY